MHEIHENYVWEKTHRHGAIAHRMVAAWGIARAFAVKNTVLLIAAALAILSMFLVPPDAAYLGYFDLSTLSCLFSTLAVICALKNIHFFVTLAKRIVRLAGSVRMLTLALVYITFIGSMFIANDMALLTFLPLGYIALTATGKEKYMAPLFILQNIAANLGGMLTPFGNPQNLYIYTKFHIPTGEFMGIMLPPFLIAMALFTAISLLFPNEPLSLGERHEKELPPLRTAFYLLLFVLTILTVFRVIPYYVCLVIVLVSILIADRRALLRVDYPLLLTFAFFFLLAGNVARIEAVSSFFSALLAENTLLTSILSCQVISNVPSAILLSEFTSDYHNLLLGVNIGGVGTLISSLASLITFREYTTHVKGKTASYIGLFSLFNFGFLIVLTAAVMLLGL